MWPSKNANHFLGPDCYFENKDIAVAIYADKHLHESTQNTVNSVLSKWNEKDNEITMMWNVHCMSAEWPAVIYIHTCTLHKYNLSDEWEKKVTLSTIIPELYTGISRARVYSATIMRDYNATNIICKYDEQLIEELKQRRDVCRIVEVETHIQKHSRSVDNVRVTFGFKRNFLAPKRKF